ncbi:MAG: hypothetical protein HY823_05780 [Acidobacteria bacterium]|nr:hypothetical protein [Acidobacteriota bacterium]
MPTIPSRILPLALSATCLLGESSEYPVNLNLPSTERMQFWDIGILFSHRFLSAVQGHGKDLYGLDGFAYAGFGVGFGIKPIPGMNVLLYRTADNKTFVAGLQQQLFDKSLARAALRIERFDETVPHLKNEIGEVGISGTVVQLPVDVFLGDYVIVNLVPTYLSRTTTQEKPVFNAGVGLRLLFTDKFNFVGEYYPRPSKIAKTFKPGWAAGFSYKTFKHRFSLFGTNNPSTTANQVLSGDYGTGPGNYTSSSKNQGTWSIGFNVARVF